MAIKDMLAQKLAQKRAQADAPVDSSHTSSVQDVNTEKATPFESGHVPFLTARTFFMAMLVSMGGIVFGYDTGQISGFLDMDNFKQNFAQRSGDGTYSFSNVREGLIVAMVSEPQLGILEWQLTNHSCRLVPCLER